MKKVSIFLAAVFFVAGVSAVQAGEAVTAKYPVELYGQVKVDMSLDDSEVKDGNYGVWVGNEKANDKLKDKSLYNLHARDSRLGLKITGPEYEDLVTKSVVELDFNGGGAENGYVPRLRHAYVDLMFPDANMDLLIGQTWDVIMPLVPSIYNYYAMWYQGNVGFRRPQVRLTKDIAVEEDVKVKLQGALTRSIGSGSQAVTDTSATPLEHDYGELSGMPGLQGRIGVSLPVFNAMDASFGLNGAVGKETTINTTNGDEKDYDSNLFGIDANVPVTEQFSVMGEFWTGENVDEFLGGIGQGINTTLQKSVEATGFWIAGKFMASDAWTFSLGYGMDDPDDAQLNVGARDENKTVFGNATYKFSDATKFGFEIQSMTTDYKVAAGSSAQDGDDLRFQFTCINSF